MPVYARSFIPPGRNSVTGRAKISKIFSWKNQAGIIAMTMTIKNPRHEVRGKKSNNLIYWLNRVAREEYLKTIEKQSVFYKKLIEKGKT